MTPRNSRPRGRLPGLLALGCALAVAGCGEEEAVPADNAVEAREQNSVELDGLRYRVNLFRQLNPRIAPDDALYDGPRPGDGEGIYAAFLRICNETDTRQAPTPLIRLEDAFGQSFPRVGPPEGNDFAYHAQILAPGACLPGEDAVANRSVSGAVIAFRVPFDQLGDRPFVLELRQSGDDGDASVRRIQLDL